ncbi:hypothetical protein EGI32_11045 [Ferruginibacter sp. HRS2-29]|nr:hypothetical protein [Ferruginibacter sp. HRS2-29]
MLNGESFEVLTEQQFLLTWPWSVVCGPWSVASAQIKTPATRTGVNFFSNIQEELLLRGLKLIMFLVSVWFFAWPWLGVASELVFGFDSDWMPGLPLSLWLEA